MWSFEKKLLNGGTKSCRKFGYWAKLQAKYVHVVSSSYNQRILTNTKFIYITNEKVYYINNRNLKSYVFVYIAYYE